MVKYPQLVGNYSQKLLIMRRNELTLRPHCVLTDIFYFDKKSLSDYQQQHKFFLLFSLDMQKFFQQWLNDMHSVHYPLQYYLTRLRSYLATADWFNPDCLPTRARIYKRNHFYFYAVEFVFGKNGNMLQIPTDIGKLYNMWNKSK